MPNHLPIRPYCLRCGDYFPKTQQVSDHLAGHGCQRCSNNAPWTHERLRQSIKENNLEVNLTLSIEDLPPEDQLRSWTPLTLTCNAQNHRIRKTVNNFVHNDTGPNCTTCSIIARNLAQTNDRATVIANADAKHTDPNKVKIHTIMIELQPTRSVTKIVFGLVVVLVVMLAKTHISYNGSMTISTVMAVVVATTVLSDPNFQVDTMRAISMMIMECWSSRRVASPTWHSKARIYRIRAGLRRSGLSFNVVPVADVYFEVGQGASDLEQAILGIRDEQEVAYTHHTRFHGSTEAVPAGCISDVNRY